MTVVRVPRHSDFGQMYPARPVDIRPAPDTLHFTVDGEPAPQGSKRHVGKGIMVESSTKLRPWRDKVAYEAREAASPFWVPLRGPVHVELLFRFNRPKTHFGTGRNADRVKPKAPSYKASLPDLDKLCRAVLDGLTDAGVFGNDGQVAVLIAEKRYADRPGLHVRVRPLDAVAS